MLKDLRNRHLSGRIGGLVAVCSAHPQVLAAAAARAKDDGTLLLVEATANQVNLYGGYTGMTPSDFADQLTRLATDGGLAPGQVMLGADHLGPHPWRHLPAREAMAHAEALARAVVAAGFQKLHLDTGRRCADDPRDRLPVKTAALRAASLCRAAESAAGHFHRPSPFYVIGSEVPTPGGGLGQNGVVAVSDPQDLRDELADYKEAFSRAGVDQAWERIIAVVVQPGVDFDDHRAAVYNPSAAAALSAFHDRLPGAMTFEIHATDYQPPSALTQMVRDHFCLLKIGPCLTSALREALFALAHIENELPGLSHRSNLMAVMEQLMQTHPEHGNIHYDGTGPERQYLRRYGLRDRIRYYWPRAEARQACEQLMHNLHRPIPHPLLRQFLPDLAGAIAVGSLSPAPEAILQARIRSALAPYADACRHQADTA
ncbi:class II D-tagatose-bisphosphate aldolase non-catalytic subunit [uncultured Desulfosarcina sp.]|uniref:class II D-tagatose-bisphosphate aldolase non-catalytic subunit n=1 Tax=uncultured Desulfosarcina sp. TaxID=218289 RepID=UPI0029C5FDD1|nr:class II D-tagatose-bisphosphate aldolase, non-catalytic subunit [uncultured Desulfosarcina sp.]